jgi:hypothetical protein
MESEAPGPSLLGPGIAPPILDFDESQCFLKSRCQRPVSITPAHRRRPDTQTPHPQPRNPQRRLILKRPRHNLHPDRQPSGELPTGTTAAGASQRVEPLRVPPRIQILDRPPLDIPLTLAMPERGNARHRAQQHRILASSPPASSRAANPVPPTHSATPAPSAAARRGNPRNSLKIGLSSSSRPRISGA